MKEKGKSEKTKRRMEEGLDTIHFGEIDFGEELSEHTRVSAGNPFSTSDPAVKLPALAVESWIRQ